MLYIHQYIEVGFKEHSVLCDEILILYSYKYNKLCCILAYNF